MRKQLLVAESEINRSLLVREMAPVASNVREFSQRIRALGDILSAISSFIAEFGGAGAAKSPAPEPAHASSSNGHASHPWMRAVLNGAGIVSSLWTAYQSVRRARKHE